MILWTLTREEGTYGFPRRSMHGHSHFVQDVVISSDGQFALSGSWDGTLRLWDLNTGGDITTVYREHTSIHPLVNSRFSSYTTTYDAVSTVCRLPVPAQTCPLSCLRLPMT